MSNPPCENRAMNDNVITVAGGGGRRKEPRSGRSEFDRTGKGSTAPIRTPSAFLQSFSLQHLALSLISNVLGTYKMTGIVVGK